MPPADTGREGDGRERARIVVVDDDVAFLSLMQELLVTEAGYELLPESRISQGYEHVKRTSPDLVMLDLADGTPNAGWDVLELLTRDPETCRIPVLLCTAATDQLHKCRQRTEELNVDVLSKPFDIDVLLQRVQSLIGTERSIHDVSQPHK